MNITHLREFIEVAHCLSFSRAADSMNITQSSLSKHIMALEKECGVALVERGNAHVSLTAEGEVLFEDAIMLVDQHDAAIRHVRMLKETPAVSIGGLYKNPIFLELMGIAQAALEKEGTTISVTYHDYRHQPFLELAREQTVDLCITSLCEDDELAPEITSVALFSDPLIALVKQTHPFAQRDSVSFREMDDQSVFKPVGSYSSIAGSSTIAHFIQKYGINPDEKPIFVRSIHDLATVHNKDNVLLMEKTLLQTQPFPQDYVMVPFQEDDVCFRFYGIHHTQNGNPALSLLLEKLLEARSQRQLS